MTEVDWEARYTRKATRDRRIAFWAWVGMPLYVALCAQLVVVAAASGSFLATLIGLVYATGCTVFFMDGTYTTMVDAQRWEQDAARVRARKGVE